MAFTEETSGAVLDEDTIYYQNLADLSDMPIINYKTSVVRVGDIANLNLQGRIVISTYDFPIVQTIPIVTAVADDVLRTTGYPLAQVNFKSDRIANKIQIGDYFVFNDASHGIEGMVCVLLSVSEAGLSSEELNITAQEAIDYLSPKALINDATIGGAGNVQGSATPDFSSVFKYVSVIESPYAISGDFIGLSAFVSRYPGTVNIGYNVYASTDNGFTYNFIDTFEKFTPYGEVAVEYSNDTYEVDDLIGIQVNSTDLDFALLTTTTRADLFTTKNLMLVGDELMSFQSIEVHPTIANRYILSGIYRGRFDTSMQTHAVGTPIFVNIAENSFYLTDELFEVGTIVKFKFVPYTDSRTGDEDGASIYTGTLIGRAKTPYTPINLNIADAFYEPTYTADIVINWLGRIRGEGAGYGDANIITDATPTWEGLFEVEIWVLGVLVRTTSAIDAISWTYTSAMNIADNTALADEVVVKVLNYSIDSGVTYSSSQIELSVTKE